MEFINSILNFFKSDPKNYFSLIAIMLTILNFIHSCVNQREQNLRWDNLNVANITLLDAKFLVYKQLPKQDAQEMVWGYKPTLFFTVEQGIYQDSVQIPYSLRLVKVTTDKSITEEQGNFFFTINDGINEMKRLGLNGKQCTIMKRYDAQFNFKNVGRTNAKDVQIEIRMVEPKNNNEGDISSPVEITPDSSFSKIFTFLTGVNDNFSTSLKFEIKIKYIGANNKPKDKTIPVIYDIKRNFWQYGI